MNPKPKLLQIVRPTEGGIGRHIITLVSGLKEEFDVTVACPQKSSLEDKLLSENIKTLPLPLAGEVSLKRDYTSFNILRNFMRKERIHLAHAHGAKAALIARPAALWAGVPSVYTVHNSIFNENWPAWKNNIAAAVEYVLSWSTDCILAVSNALCEEIKYRQKISPSKIKVIHNGILLSNFNKCNIQYNFKEKWNIPPNRTVVGTVARMAPQKGLSVLIKAAEQLIDKYDIHFLIVGDGPLRDKLEEEIRLSSMDDYFTFTGVVDNIAQAYAAMDIFVLPSITEGLPLTILEAMAFSLPVVATSVGGVPEIIKHGECGFLVPPDNHKELASKIAYLLDCPSIRDELRNRGRQRVSDKFDAQKMIQKTINIYYHLLKEPNPRTNLEYEANPQ
ncbi:glycosyltransferase family 4 protein [Desulfoscipio geothermicus]|uniref:Glycosyltransferase involved in cell wall bisynthesis n=1 Tax=Desulfoscipio geothermicus DSM 3669 TaxID=1121426 RepID=A0A1I6EDU4_9FIRM|nr:glycosyltransferase family 4 protein [Desulfoscipio geothermicus]SFR15672.1 Glycosyltransferase involved in cell wall bisynthesis [Desulfoscipio geothermicus DSM 3669]